MALLVDEQMPSQSTRIVGALWMAFQVNSRVVRTEESSSDQPSNWQRSSAWDLWRFRSALHHPACDSYPMQVFQPTEAVTQLPNRRGHSLDIPFSASRITIVLFKASEKAEAWPRAPKFCPSLEYLPRSDVSRDAELRPRWYCTERWNSRGDQCVAHASVPRLSQNARASREIQKL